MSDPTKVSDSGQTRERAPHIAYEPGVLRIVDQTKLPGELDVLSLTSAGEVASAIREMRVRGAPAIGIAGAYGLAIAALQSARKADSPDHFLGMLADAAQTLEAARPTAVNLAWAVHGLLNEAKRHVNDGVPPEAVAVQLQKEAKTLHADDIAACRRIGDAGAPLLPRGANVLTHCNTGDFATGGYGTALGVIRSAWRAGALRRVYVDETRPALQGARLTTYELDGDRIPYTLITDGMAGHFMRRGDIGAVIVGADRIAANGDTANKIGTYALAVLAREHDIPFYVAAPRSTFDPDAQTGDDIPIEERSAGEVRAVQGVPIAPADAPVANPAFDVTPARYITAFITDAGVLAPPFDAAIAALGKAGAAAPATAKT